jgi:hypothetical protein
MSLINDALKRAQQAQDKQIQEKQAQEAQSQIQIAAPRAPMQVAPAAPPSRLWPLALVFLMLAVILSAGGIWYLHREKSAPLRAAASPDSSAAPAASQASTPAHPEYVVQPLTPYVPPSTEPQDTGPMPAPAASTPAQPAVDTTPNVRLEGVLYRPDKPAAIIDGRTVYVGDHVDDGNGAGVVTAITPNSVTLLWEGKSVRLRL